MRRYDIVKGDATTAGGIVQRDRNDRIGQRPGRTGANMLRSIAKILLLLAGMGALSTAFSGEPTMTNPLLSNARPWCIGRFVFDRPATSEISNQRYEIRGDGLETQYNVSPETYHSKVEALEKTLRTNQRVNPVDLTEKTGHAWLEKIVSPTKESKVFVYQEGVAKVAKLPFDTEGYMLSDGTLFHTTGWIGSSAIERVGEIYNDAYRRIKVRASCPNRMQLTARQAFSSSNWKHSRRPSNTGAP